MLAALPLLSLAGALGFGVVDAEVVDADVVDAVPFTVWAADGLAGGFAV